MTQLKVKSDPGADDDLLENTMIYKTMQSMSRLKLKTQGFKCTLVKAQHKTRTKYKLKVQNNKHKNMKYLTEPPFKGQLQMSPQERWRTW